MINDTNSGIDLGDKTRTYHSQIYIKLFVGFLLSMTCLPAHLNAKKLSFVLDTPPYRLAEAETIAGQLEELGIGVTVQTWDKKALRAEIKKGARTAYLTDWGSSYFDPYDLAHPKLTTGGRGNFSFYSNPLIDEHLKTAAFSRGNRTRKKSYHKIQHIIHAEVPWVFGYQLSNIEASSESVQGYSPAIDNRINLHDVRLGQGDTLVVGMNTSAFKSLDPAAYRGRETETVLRNIFDGLVTRTVDGFVVAQLAESWQQVDRTTYIFKLRQGPLFHNGEPVSADDVAFTFQRILHPEEVGARPSPRQGLLGPLIAVEKVTQNSIRFVLAKPFPPFLQALVHFQIVPRQYILQVGEQEFGRRPVGSGPFKFKKGSVQSEIILERFPEYYGGSPDIPPVGPAKIQQVIFRPMANPGDRVAALTAGTVSLIQAVPVADVNRLRSNHSLRVLMAEGSRSFQIELNNQKPPFDDIRVRQALNLAIDWPTILEDIYLGYGSQLATCFLPSGFGYKSTLKPYPYNPDRARQLLENAGYELK